MIGINHHWTVSIFTPISPADHIIPDAPGGPLTPVAPGGPMTPVDPGGPMTPVDPGGPITPVAPNQNKRKFDSFQEQEFKFSFMLLVSHVFWVDMKATVKSKPSTIQTFLYLFP